MSAMLAKILEEVKALPAEEIQQLKAVLNAIESNKSGLIVRARQLVGG